MRLFDSRAVTRMGIENSSFASQSAATPSSALDWTREVYKVHTLLNLLPTTRVIVHGLQRR